MMVTHVNVVFIFFLHQLREASCRPNFVFILADDVGVNDVPWNNPDLRSTLPYMNEISKKSKVLNQVYTMPVCTPSRAALLTGIYPFRYGLQRGYGETKPNGLPTGLQILPQYLKSANYSSHLIGKWHLGHCDTRYTPTERGFDTFFGSYSGAVDHWNRRSFSSTLVGLDLRNGTQITDHGEGIYSAQLHASLSTDIIRKNKGDPYFLLISTTMVHAPFQSPKTRNSQNKGSPTKETRNAMLTALDQLVREVVTTVEEKRDDTVVIFMSDNGGNQYPGIHPNHPLRGKKGQIFEGGTRVPGFVYHPRSVSSGAYDGLMHEIDWLPTILDRAGIKIPEGIDGLSQVDGIWDGKDSPRTTMIYNYDEGGTTGHNGYEQSKWQIGLRKGDYKMIWGTPNMLNKDLRFKYEIFSTNLHLYNIRTDPSESNNLATDPNYNHIVQDLKAWARQVAVEMVPVNSTPNSKHTQLFKQEGVIKSGWCLAIKNSYCTSDTLMTRLFRQPRTHIYTESKAFLYRSPIAENVLKTCVVNSEESPTPYDFPQAKTTSNNSKQKRQKKKKKRTQPNSNTKKKNQRRKKIQSSKS